MNEAGDYTRRMADFAAAHSYEDLPLEVVDKAKEILLDTMGAILLGSRAEYTSVRTLSDMATDGAGSGSSTVFGRKSKAPVLDALLANGTMGYAADAEGGGASAMHAAAVFVPTVLTLGEHLRSSGKSAVAALSLAYDVGCRVSDACNPEVPFAATFHPSAFFGHFGAAAGAGHLLGLDTEQFVNALGLASINAGGLYAWADDPTEDSRPFVIGVAAQSGARAAMLAKRGMRGPVRSLDDTKYSIYDAYSVGDDLPRLMSGLGEEYRMLGSFGYKRYPCCHNIHSGIDALLSIMEKQQLRAAEIESITHRVRPSCVKMIDDNLLKSHNSQYILLVAAVNGGIMPDDILLDRRSDPAVAHLYGRAKLLPDEELDAVKNSIGAKVEVRMADGSVYEERVDAPRGWWNNPLSDDELEAKFLKWAGSRIDEGQARRIIDATNRLEELDDVGELTRLLAA